MYIQPDSTIILLQDIPLTEGGEDTLYWDSLGGQSEYFSHHAVATFERQTYQRVNREYLRVDINAERVYGCNYLMFKNEAYGDKWFYAFVKSVEYINDNCTEVKFAIDPMQTWFFDYQLRQCFVERESVSVDTIGRHIEPEPVECGEYVYNNYSSVGTGTSLGIVVFICEQPKFLSEVKGGIYDNVFSAGTLEAWLPSEIAGLETKLNILLDSHPETYVEMYMTPAINLGGKHAGEKLSNNGYSNTFSYTAVSTTTTLDGYKPKNNKMYTYPYNYFAVENNAGTEMSLRYEFFSNGAPQLQVTGTLRNPVEMSCMPIHYKGSGSSEYRNERLDIKGFPMCGWAVDSFSQWSAQSAIPTMISTGVAVAGTLLGMPVIGAFSPYTALGMGSGIIQSTAGAVGSLLGGAYRASHSGVKEVGQLNCSSNDTAHNRMNFKYGRKSVKEVIAKRIDDYFTMYGYCVGETKLPSRKNRSRFTYIKTQGCNIGGRLPADDAMYIANRFDAGVRFWTDHQNVSNYTIPNTPLGPTATYGDEKEGEELEA